MNLAPIPSIAYLRPGLPNRITEVVCSYFGVDPDAIKTKSRKRVYLYPRQWIMYFMTQEGHSDQTIAEALSLDRTTVLHGVKKIRGLIEVDREFQQIARDMEKYFDFKTVLD